jgi:hypothetical protein
VGDSSLVIRTRLSALESLTTTPDYVDMSINAIHTLFSFIYSSTVNLSPESVIGQRSMGQCTSCFVAGTGQHMSWSAGTELGASNSWAFVSLCGGILHGYFAGGRNQPKLQHRRRIGRGHHHIWGSLAVPMRSNATQRRGQSEDKHFEPPIVDDSKD